MGIGCINYSLPIFRTIFFTKQPVRRVQSIIDTRPDISGSIFNI